MNACPSCGRQNQDRVAQCPQCGTALAPPSASPPPTDSDRPVLLKAFPDEFAAQAAAQALLASGLPSSLGADNCGGAYSGLDASKGFQLFVRANDLERARELLVDFEAEKPEVDAETAEQARPELDPATATTWTPSQKARLWFLVGLGLGIAITTAILIDSGASSQSSYTGVTEDDTDGDGKTDRWSHYRGGQLERDEMDDNFDGMPDSCFVLKDNRVVRREADSNFDGKIDIWTRYFEGRPDTTRADTDFNGRPDVTHRHSAGVTVSADWVDQDSGKLWKRDAYRNGYLRESLIDTDRDGTFDTKITYDAFENPVRTAKLE